MKLDELTSNTLHSRHKELLSSGGVAGVGEVPFETDGYLIEIDTGKIYAD